MVGEISKNFDETIIHRRDNDYMKDVVSISDFTKEEIISILDCAQEIKDAKHDKKEADKFFYRYQKSIDEILKGSRVASLFLENSTRTNFSSRSAAGQFGAFIDGFATIENTSLKKGETWEQTLAMFAGYGFDSIVMRSPIEGMARWSVKALVENQEHMIKISKNLGLPYNYKRPFVINGGDGSNQHPTQCLLDLFTIREAARSKGMDLDSGLDIALLNDLKYGRTNSSIMSVSPLFGFNLHLANPNRFEADENKLKFLESRGVKITKYGEDFMSALEKAFVAYQSRPQKERVAQGEDMSRLRKIGQINLEMYKQLAGKAPFLMHPLPIDAKTFMEISHDMRDHPLNITKLQSSNGIYIRAALLALGYGSMENKCSLEKREGNDFSVIELELTKDRRIKKLENPRSGYIEGEGVVIDHIPMGMARRLAGIMGLEYEKISKNITDYLPKRKGGDPVKDMIKIHANYRLSDKQIEAIALLAPNATISIIENSKVKEKYRGKIGCFVEERINCGNQKCVTNVDYEDVTSVHRSLGDGLYQCGYCEKFETLESIFNREGFNYIRI